MTTATSAWRPQAVGMAADNDVGPGVVDAEPRVVVPPINFSLVAPGIYRSGHPNKKNISFLRRLKLKSVMYLESTDEYRKDSKDFVDREGIELFRIDLAKEDALFTREGREQVHTALRTALNTTNHPMLIHDDMGKSTTSLLVSLIRRYQRWSLTGIYAEGDMFAGQAGGSEGDGIGEVGREFIALFDPRQVKLDPATTPLWLR